LAYQGYEQFQKTSFLTLTKLYIPSYSFLTPHYGKLYHNMDELRKERSGTMPSLTSDLQFYDLSHPWGQGAPLWPYFPDIEIERFHYHAKSGVLSQQITTFMHSTTHTDAQAHVIEGMPFMDEVPLESFLGTAVVVSIPKGKWKKIMPEDLERAEPKIEPGDIVIINSGWHKYYGDNRRYFAYSPGLYREAGEWLAEKKVKADGVDQQALDHPLATAMPDSKMSVVTSTKSQVSASPLPHFRSVGSRVMAVLCAW
jgi:kynurenine formamidase